MHLIQRINTPAHSHTYFNGLQISCGLQKISWLPNHFSCVLIKWMNNIGRIHMSPLWICGPSPCVLRGNTQGVCVRLWANLQVVQQGASQAHLPQRHVRVAGVEEALDLRADVQSQGLNPAHLHWTQLCSRVVELQQALLRQHEHTLGYD